MVCYPSGEHMTYLFAASVIRVIEIGLDDVLIRRGINEVMPIEIVKFPRFVSNVHIGAGEREKGLLGKIPEARGEILLSQRSYRRKIDVDVIGERPRGSDQGFQLGS